MTAFRWHRLIARAVPEEDRFAQSGSRRDQGERLVVRWRSSAVEDFDFVRSEQQNPVCHGFEIVEILNSGTDRKSTRLNSSHVAISYAVICLKKKNPKLHWIWSA